MEQDLSDSLKLKIHGHVKIMEYSDEKQIGTDTGNIVLNKSNAIHNENASIIIARAIANRDNGHVYAMYFGTGGATIDPLGQVIFSSPNVIGNADLNLPVYFEVVDDTKGAPIGNQMAVRHINGTLFSDVEIRCVLSKSEPLGQPATDNLSALNLNSDQFAIDEIGLKSQDGLLLTHITFTPIVKSSNRIFEIIYTLRISIAS